MKKLIFGLILAFAVVGGAVAFSTLYDRPANADATARIDPSQMMRNAKDLPSAHYADCSLVFN